MEEVYTQCPYCNNDKGNIPLVDTVTETDPYDDFDGTGTEKIEETLYRCSNCGGIFRHIEQVIVKTLDEPADDENKSVELNFIINDFNLKDNSVYPVDQAIIDKLVIPGEEDVDNNIWNNNVMPAKELDNKIENDIRALDYVDYFDGENTFFSSGKCSIPNIVSVAVDFYNLPDLIKDIKDSADINGIGKILATMISEAENDSVFKNILKNRREFKKIANLDYDDSYDIETSLGRILIYEA